ncbi:MAG: GNAT family N-acetyltransferase [Bdellovibrionaceae bacterium]|nr:GNAT family N-acetyltransferase [Pseudobdellovibrionaceae bacterium]
MKLFAAYLAERRGSFLLHEEGVGFATYEISGEECYIIDIFVAKEHRRKKSATSLADQIASIARLRGCKYLKGTVDLSASGARESSLALMQYGFRPVHAQGDVIYFRKDL